ncbi:hypothetical protein DL98DRAFT_592664 [Cadophora sp. DSE1049]|nr:hypothetical protein DL98DRAFT_592664 [Cadophora sp. DSE1049]
MASPECDPAVEIVEEEDPQTPTLNTINVADAYDWQHRANTAEQQLSVVITGLERQKRHTRRLHSQIKEYIDALGRLTRDNNHAINQCQLLSNANAHLSQEVRKAKLMVETLEAVILTLYKSSADKGDCSCTSSN